MRENAYEFRSALASDFALAESLLKNRPELIDHAVFGDSESALHFFATENQIEIVDWLIDHNATPNGTSDDDSPLHAASQLGHLEICRILVEAGANLDSKDLLDETPLHKASGGGHIKILELLLNSGADPSIPEMCGELPIDQALPRKIVGIRAIFNRNLPSI